IIAPNPAPTLNGLAPSSAVAGDPAFTLTVTGTNFVAASEVRWNGLARPTTFESATQLTAAVAAADVATAAAAQVPVASPGPGGGTSTARTFMTVLPTRLLTVKKAGTGAGKVMSDTPAMDCGVTCTARVDTGTSLMLQETASPGSAFVGWSGPCAGTAST